MISHRERSYLGALLLCVIDRLYLLCTLVTHINVFLHSRKGGKKGSPDSRPDPRFPRAVRQSGQAGHKRR
ncbi:hypothetical protein LZ31DRAFT_205794 [Colletotrichum somersetense]|nr:hypothetical protein LZ31DRAFT_205794 [Colletotrichum somersetense]